MAHPGDHPFDTLRAIHACAPRAGLPNVAARLAAGQPTTIAYFGGSITEADGWRPMTTDWFRATWPAAAITEVMAAIGGTGTDLGVFRVGKDVLAHKPHLVFIEFAVNDGSTPAVEILRNLEGIVRQIRAADPATDICLVYTLTDGHLPTLLQGKFIRSSSTMELLAEHYGIPSIHIAHDVLRLYRSGDLVMRGTEDQRRAVRDRMIFSYDGVHPYRETGQTLYAQRLTRTLPQVLAAGVAGPHPLPASFRSDYYAGATMVPAAALERVGRWTCLPATDPFAARFAPFMPELWTTNEPGAAVRLRFSGTLVGVYDVIGPGAGQYEVTIDGVCRTVPRFDAWCNWWRKHNLILARDLSPGEHTLEIALSARRPDKAAILAARNESIGDPAAFAPCAMWLSHLLLVGAPR